jgi:hypothetical protein
MAIDRGLDRFAAKQEEFLTMDGNQKSLGFVKLKIQSLSL